VFSLSYKRRQKNWVHCTVSNYNLISFGRSEIICIQNHAQMLRAETVLTVAAPKIVKKLQLIMGHERVKNPVSFHLGLLLLLSH